MDSTLTTSLWCFYFIQYTCIMRQTNDRCGYFGLLKTWYQYVMNTFWLMPTDDPTLHSFTKQLHLTLVYKQEVEEGYRLWHHWMTSQSWMLWSVDGRSPEESNLCFLLHWYVPFFLLQSRKHANKVRLYYMLHPVDGGCPAKKLRTDNVSPAFVLLRLPVVSLIAEKHAWINPSCPSSHENLYC